MQLPDGTVTLMVTHMPRRHSADTVLQECAASCALTSCLFFNPPWNSKTLLDIGYVLKSFSSTEGVTANLDLFVKNAKPSWLQSGHVPYLSVNQKPVELIDALRMFCSASVYQELLEMLAAETASKNIRISKVPGPQNVADANTKPADKRSLEFCRSKMGVTEIPKQFRDAVL